MVVLVCDGGDGAASHNNNNNSDGGGGGGGGVDDSYDVGVRGGCILENTVDPPLHREANSLQLWARFNIYLETWVVALLQKTQGPVCYWVVKHCTAPKIFR